MKKFDRKLILEDGSEYYGYGFGSDGERITEIVFNTSPVGYQEIISDPSYTYQTVVMAYPLIGNYGITEGDFETETPTIGGLAVRDYNDQPSNFRSVCTLSEMMEKFGIPGISGIDTRKLVRSIRNLGSRKALLTDADTSLQEGLLKLAAYKIPTDAVERVSRKTVQKYEVSGGTYHVAAIDCGMKQNIVRCFNRRGCSVSLEYFCGRNRRHKARWNFSVQWTGRSGRRPASDRTGKKAAGKISDVWNLSGASDHFSRLWSQNL